MFRIFRGGWCCFLSQFSFQELRHLQQDLHRYPINPSSHLMKFFEFFIIFQGLKNFVQVINLHLRDFCLNPLIMAHFSSFQESSPLELGLRNLKGYYFMGLFSAMNGQIFYQMTLFLQLILAIVISYQKILLLGLAIAQL